MSFQKITGLGSLPMRERIIRSASRLQTFSAQDIAKDINSDARAVGLILRGVDEVEKVQRGRKGANLWRWVGCQAAN